MSRTLGDFDVWYRKCHNCGHDTGKSTLPKEGIKTCWECGHPLQRDFSYRALKEQLDPDTWTSVKERPLYTEDEHGNWTCTAEGGEIFLAAVPTNKGWDYALCIVQDEIGLQVYDNEGMFECWGWALGDVTHYKLVLLNHPHPLPV